jgi:hypothetical protein
MADPKYKKYYQLMTERNKELFDKFSPIHTGFATDADAWADKFHTIGRDVVDVIRDWERRLCSGTEKGGYAAYSAKLAEKFWAEIKKDYPLIDQVGLRKKTA